MLPARLPESGSLDVNDPRLMIADLFTQRAAFHPDSVAVICEQHQMTFREVDGRSNQIANHLCSLGVKPEALVGIFLPRSEMLIVTLLAVLKSGGAYVPLDPTYPQERLSHVIADSGMRVLITARKVRDMLPPLPTYLTVLDIEDAALTTETYYAAGLKAMSGNLAYVLYTSGSTGVPKGVMVEHRNVINFFTGMDRAIGCEAGIWLAVTSVAFDISVLELLWTLTRGFTVVMHTGDSYSIADEIIRNGVTHLQMTPSLARMLTLDPRTFSALSSLKQILLGGEAVPASLILRLREVFKGEIYNMYGPTETTIWSTTYRVDEVSDYVPIGRPVINTPIFLLDEDLNPVVAGDAGELFIGGLGVARGYWNQPELTAERFLTVPALSGTPIYRTGDRARTLPDGNLQFLGRCDHQVKLRGHRIEPAEIEALLERCPGVSQAIVLLREDRQGNPRLVAYLKSERDTPATASDLKAALASKLPEVMIPSEFRFLVAMPLTQNGKIDRAALLALPAPGWDPPRNAISGSSNQTGDDMQRIVAAAWQDALGLTAVGLHDNFFDLGAHSLVMAEVQAALQNSLTREIPIVDLFQYPTVSSLSNYLAGAASAGTASAAAARAERRKLARKQ